MLRALDGDAVAEDSAEQLELALAQASARAGGVGDRAVVFDQNDSVLAVDGRFGEVALGAADASQRLDPLGNRTRLLRQPLAVARFLRPRAGVDDLAEAFLAERIANRRDEFDGEIGVPVGEQRHREVGEMPRHGRATPAGWFGRRPLDQPQRLQRLQMLAYGGVGEAEPRRQFGAVADSTRFSRSMMRRLASVSCSATVGILHDFAKKALDVIAERARKIGGTTIRSISDIARHQKLKDNDEEFVSAKDMLAELSADNQALTRSLRAKHKICEQHGDVATTSLIEVWIDETERRTWFLSETVRQL